VQKIAGALKTMCRNDTVNHSAEDKVEQATHVLLEGKLKMRNHENVSNFVVSNCRYNVLLGMPWHVACEKGHSEGICSLYTLVRGTRL
jgi:hypothetical protein